MLVLFTSMSKRLVGLDFARGIAILGVILSHSFQGRVSNWDAETLFNLASKVPVVLLIIVFIPIVVASLLGSLFFFITAIGVTISSIRIRSKGTKYVVKYIVMKMFFAFFLKLLEDGWKSIFNYYPFKQHHIALPQISIHYWSHSLDVVGFFNWSVPLVVLGVTSIPNLHYYYQMAILCIVASVIIYFNDNLLTLFGDLAKWLESKEYYFFYYLVMKIADGQFSLGQYGAYGLLGAAYGILFCNTNNFKTYWKFTWIQSIPFMVVGIPMLFTVPDVLSKIFTWIKPTGYLFLMGGLQSLAMMLALQLNDNPNRPVEKRHSLIRNTTFLRRANALSLTAYISEEFFTQAIYVVFKTFFGPGADVSTHTCFWGWPVVLIYVIVCVILWCMLIRLWEKADFRFSAENQLSAIMSWLFQAPYNKVNYAKTIYGPLNDVKAELEEKMKQQTKETTSEVKEMQEVNSVQQESVIVVDKESV